MKEASIILQVHDEFDWPPGNWTHAWAVRAMAAGIITKEMCNPVDFQDLIINTLHEVTSLGHFNSWDYTFLGNNMLHVSCHYDTDEQFVTASQYIQEKTGLKVESAKDDKVELIVIVD